MNIISSNPGIFDEAAATAEDVQSDPSISRSVTFTGDDGSSVTVTFQPSQS